MEAVGEYQQELFNYLSDLGIIALQSEMQEIERIVLKRMYSEEDLKRAFQVGFNVGYNDEQSPSYLTFEEWFNKYKKQ
jgi:hypothetical protein